MNASTATANTPLRRADMRLRGMPAGGLAPRDLDVLFQVRLGRLGTPRARLAWRLVGFVTNRHE